MTRRLFHRHRAEFSMDLTHDAGAFLAVVGARYDECACWAARYPASPIRTLRRWSRRNR